MVRATLGGRVNLQGISEGFVMRRAWVRCISHPGRD